MKKIVITLVIALALVLTLTHTAEARPAADRDNTLIVGASIVPHAVLLNMVREDLAAQGITLRVVEFTDFVQPNMALMAGDLDANFFQHIPYLESNDAWAARLVPVFGVHYEPFGLYSTRHRDIASLPNGASIAIPNDPTNGGRALLLLQAHGLITLRADAGLRATPMDIVNNPRNFRFHQLEAAQLPRSLQDVDAATINGNFAMQAGLNPLRDSLIIEGPDSPYVNYVVARRGSENDRRIIALRNALLTPRIRDFILNTYDGGVVPVF